MIKIAERLRPFSHQNGSCCLIPGSSLLVQAYPALIQIKNLEGLVIKEFPLEIQGPLKHFTVVQDLERGCVTVFSEKYCLHVLPSLEISLRKHPPLAPLSMSERLSLGSHKKQDWQFIINRRDFKEIFPFWFRLGSLLSQVSRKGGKEGIFTLLDQCKEVIASKKSEEIVPAFEKLFLAGFSHWFVPRFFDDEYQGILNSETLSESNSPLVLLSEGSMLIRSLFFSSNKHGVFLLPHLPPEFFSGRFLHLECESFGHIDLEWTKKSLRRIHFHASHEGEFALHFPSELRRCRLVESSNSKERVFLNGDLLAIKSGSHYLLDQFQK